MIKRTISTLLLWLVVGGLLYFFQARAGILLILFLAAASQHELYRMLEKSGYQPLRKTGILAGLLYLAAAYLLPQFEAAARFQSFGTEALSLALVVLAGAALFTRGADRIGTLASTTLGFVLIPFLLHYFIRILQLPGNEISGLLLAFWIVVLVKFADIGAYLTGSLAGRHKLAPSLSPGKTWEGAAGGILLSALVSAGYVWLARDHFPAAVTPLAGAAIAIPVAAVSIVSDLLESAFKRRAQMKDSGNTIPGIGGAFDLTDSLILSAPIGYMLLLLLS